eukprot:5323248-Amphidinium_carterae.1
MQHRAGQPDGIVHMHAFVTQVTCAPIFAYQAAEEVVIKCARASLMVKGHILAQELDQDRIERLTSKCGGGPLSAFAELLPARAREHILVIWGVRLDEASSSCAFLCRVSESKVDAFLGVLGSGCIWVDTPPPTLVKRSSR